MPGVLALGCRNPRKRRLVLFQMVNLQPIGWRVANILNKPTIPFYSFEPPTALHFVAVFSFMGGDEIYMWYFDDVFYARRGTG